MRSRRPLILTTFVAAVIATTAAHCDPPPQPFYPESATLEILTGPAVTAGDIVRFRAGLNDGVAPKGWSLQFVNPSGRPLRPEDGYPTSECGGLAGTAIPNPDPAVEFSAETECVLPTHVENGTWRVRVAFDGGRVGPEVTFEVTGGSDDQQGPTIEITEVPTQPVTSGQSFEVAARVADPNGVSRSEGFLHLSSNFGTNPQCMRISAVPYPSFDLEVRYRCTTTVGSVGGYKVTFLAMDLMGRTGESTTNPVITVV